MKHLMSIAAMVALAAPAVAQDVPPPAPAPAPAHDHQMMTAQTPPSPGKDHGYAWFLSMGWGSVSWGDVNDAFNGAGYEDLAGSAFLFGGGGYGTIDRLVIGGEGYSYHTGEVSSSAGRETRSVGGTFLFNLGYMLVSKPSHRVYPLLGIGGHTTSIRVARAGAAGLGPDVNAPSFNQVLQDPGYRSRLNRTGMALSLGVGAEWIPIQRQRPNGYYGFMIGVRAGYTFSPVKSDWYLYDVPVTGGPDDMGQGFHVRFSLGGAGARHPRAAHQCPMHGGQACPMHQGGQACPMGAGAHQHEGAAACRQ